jgi:hypothetical protein
MGGKRKEERKQKETIEREQEEKDRVGTCDLQALHWSLVNCCKVQQLVMLATHRVHIIFQHVLKYVCRHTSAFTQAITVPIFEKIINADHPDEQRFVTGSPNEEQTVLTSDDVLLKRQVSRDSTHKQAHTQIYTQTKKPIQYMAPFNGKMFIGTVKKRTGKNRKDTESNKKVSSVENIDAHTHRCNPVNHSRRGSENDVLSNF